VGTTSGGESEVAVTPVTGRTVVDARPPQDSGPGKTDRFIDFYRQQFAPLVVLASAVARDATFAEDIVQETMHLVHDRWESLAASGMQRAWARRTVINRAIDRKRRIGRERAASPKLLASAPAEFSPSEDRHLWDAVRSLPPKQRAAIALYYIDGYSTAEVADVLGCTNQAARTTMHRARTALRRKLGSRPDYEGRR
jgi:RNA polymerase sigma factor (sigma-70 family)